MLHYMNGDLLKSDCTVIMHQANCFSVMGAGIAKSIAQMYPEAAAVDKYSDYSPEYKFGKFTYAIIENGVTVVNLYGQYNLGVVDEEKQAKRMKMLKNALSFFIYTAKSGSNNNINLQKIGVPHGMGCGLAGGDWGTVEKILKDVSEEHNVDIYIYKLD